MIEQFESDRAKTTTDIWHHDVTGRKNPNLVSVLQATEVPFGADTMWSSASAAFEWLPDALKRLFLELDIEHDAVYMALRHDFGSSEVLSPYLTWMRAIPTPPLFATPRRVNSACLSVMAM